MTLLRSLGTVAAALALLTLPFRGIAECRMPSGGSDASAHRAMGHAVGEEGNAPAADEQGQGAPLAHDTCPDLAGCTAIGAPVAAVALLAPASIAPRAETDAPSRIDAPPASLEPPPPKG